jgi:uncharacterized protein (DUF2267 family)
MYKTQFIARVQELAGLATPAEAATAAEIVLNLLRHRMGVAGARRVEEELEPELRALWHSEAWFTTFLKHFRAGHYDFETPEDLFDLVAEDLADQHLALPVPQVTAAVLHALKEAVTADLAVAAAAKLPIYLQEFWRQA